MPNIRVLAVLSLAFAQIVTAAYAAANDSASTRQLVRMPPMMQHHMLANMRDHLATIHEIQNDLAHGRFDTAGQIAEQHLGMSSLESHDAPRMAPFMPKTMQNIGTEMHRRASRFAVIAQEGDLPKSLAALADITNECVACHALYRLR